jgi:hypothetical protein
MGPENSHMPPRIHPPLLSGVKAPPLPALEPLADLPLDADAPARRREATPIGAAIGALLRRLRLPDDAWMQELLDAWPALVGAEVAACARPGKLVNGVFYIFVRDSAALFELRRFQLPALEAAIRQHLKPRRVRQVRLAIDPERDALGGGDR